MEYERRRRSRPQSKWKSYFYKYKRYTNNRKFMRSALRLMGAGAFVAIFFQNCFSSQLIEESSYSSTSENQIPIVHPPDENLLPPTQQLQVVNRVYIEGLFRDIFTDENRVELPSLDNILHQWTINRGIQLGYSCDVYGSYSGRDCVSNIHYGSTYTNATGPVRRSDNILRQSYVIKLCESVLEDDAAIHLVLPKIGRTVTQKANHASLSLLWDLFYRGDLIDELSFNTLMDLDSTLYQDKEVDLDRWRALMLTVCESPGWQSL